jgi:hypothetical protein
MIRVSACLFLICALLPAQTAKQQKGRQVLDAALEALGGARFLAMEDRVEAGRVYSFYHGRLRGLSRATIYTRYLTTPDPPSPDGLYVRERQAFGKDEDYAIVFDERQGWNITFRGASPVAEDVLKRYQDTTRRNIFYILRHRLKEPGLIVEHSGTDIFDNMPVDIIDITDSENITVTVFLQQSTKLPVRQLFHRRDPVTKVRNEEVTIFGKYRDVGGGVQWPFNMSRRRNGEKIFEIFSEAVTINQGLSDQLFALSADLKILKPPK